MVAKSIDGQIHRQIFVFSFENPWLMLRVSSRRRQQFEENPKIYFKSQTNQNKIEQSSLHENKIEQNSLLHTSNSFGRKNMTGLVLLHFLMSQGALKERRKGGKVQERYHVVRG